MKDGVFKYYEGMHPIAKGAIGLIVVGGLALIGYTAYKAIKKKFEDDPQKDLEKDIKKELRVLINNGMPPSHDDSVYASAAGTILKLLDGCETASSEVAVVDSVTKIVKNKVDWLKLVDAFGTQKISDCGTFGIGKEEYVLPTLLKDQLDTNASYSINSNGFKKSYYLQDTLVGLEEYLLSKGVSI